MPFVCSICGEESTRICALCTKDACNNHLCEKCRRCSDCCECEVALYEESKGPSWGSARAAVRAVSESKLPEPAAEPQPPMLEGAGEAAFPPAGASLVETPASSEPATAPAPEGVAAATTETQPLAEPARPPSTQDSIETETPPAESASSAADPSLEEEPQPGPVEA